MKLQYVATDEHIADVFTKPLARVNFEYFGEKLGDRGSFKGELMSPEAFLMWWQDWFLPWSNVSVVPF